MGDRFLPLHPTAGRNRRLQAEAPNHHPHQVAGRQERVAEQSCNHRRHQLLIKPFHR